MGKRRYGPHVFETSNEDKPLFPEGPTKGEVIDYYERIAPHLLPHLRDRPLVMRRCPDGIEGECFYQKQIGGYFPDWIDRVKVQRRRGGDQTLVVARNRATLAYLANQAVIPIHAWLSTRDRPEWPDQLVIDLDPTDEGFAPVRSAARRCRELLEELGLRPFLKTTGSRGLHVVVALDGSAGFDEVRGFAREAMEELAARHPDELTTAIRKDRRRGRLYLDVGRNAYAQTAVAPYSLRALPGAPVATPIEWEELSRSDVGPRSWNLGNLFRRLGQRDDPWKNLRRHGTSLRSARHRLARCRA
ncbi:MAG: non-homologous end-joining DNA ligase [Acidobacteriota bacterium]|jgi:bifunctional non-homologous end joining protein LigD